MMQSAEERVTRVGSDQVTVSLMPYAPLVLGHVEGGARGIDVADAPPDAAGPAWSIPSSCGPHAGVNELIILPNRVWDGRRIPRYRTSNRL
jgi:hypothetical protein